jgi:hypothetical protein
MPWQKGVSGNPLGRPKSSKHRLEERLLTAFADDFDKHGAGVIAQVREEDPSTYLKVAASLMPKDHHVTVGTDIDSVAIVAELRALVERESGPTLTALAGPEPTPRPRKSH